MSQRVPKFGEETLLDYSQSELSRTPFEQAKTATEMDGVPDLEETGFCCIRYMAQCNGGYVYLGKSKRVENKYVAIKRFHVEDANEYEAIAKEATNMRLLSHNNILELDSSFVFDSFVYMINPAMNLGSMDDILNNYAKWGINEKAVAGIFGQVIEALVYIHQKRYVHRDIRPKHILIDSSGNVKLTGFRHMIELDPKLELCFDYDSHLQTQIYYLAPETLAQNMHGYGTKSDVYMTGITICESINGILPFGECEPLEMLHRKLNGQVPRPVDRESLEDDRRMGLDTSGRPQEHSERKFSDEFHVFVAKSLAFELYNRYSAQELKESNFLNLKHIRSLRPADILTELKLEPKDFEFTVWKQEPLMPSQPAQKYDIAFDYSSLN